MGKKILLADDSITIQKVIELTFSDEDFDVVTVGNGRLAVERVQEVRPDIVLCDIIMPEKDGYEVCDFVKKTPGLSHIPVLLLTGAFEPFDKEKAERVKADGFLAKPFEPQALITKVKDLLARTAGTRSQPPTPRPAAPTPAAAAAPAAVAPAPARAFSVPLTSPAPPAPTPVARPAPVAAPPPAVEEPAFIPAEEVEVEPAPAAPPAAAPKAAAPVEDAGFGYVDDSFEPIPEEAVAIPAAPPAATRPPAPSASTVTFKPPPDDPWVQSTVEVSLEARAQAAIQSAQAAPKAAPVFEEVEELPEEPPAPPPPAVVAAPPALAPPPAAPPVSAAAPAALPAEKPVPAEVAPPQMQFEESSFSEVAVPEKSAPGAKPSEAAEVAVPMDMVEKIAQRVVAQISEKVVREIAWEVIPDLAEALIKQEIERLKAELQKT